MLTRSTSTRMDNQRKDHIDPKASKQRNYSKQLQTHNLPTDDVENINSTNWGRDLLLTTSRGLFTEEQKGWCKKFRGTEELLYIDQHIANESKAWRKKSTYDRDWLQKGIWYGSTKLDDKLPKNVQNTIFSLKRYREKYENLENGIDSKRKKLSWSKDPKRYISRRYTITVTIHNCHDST